MSTHSISRRNFLKGSAVFAAAIPLASFLASCSGTSETAEQPADDAANAAEETTEAPATEQQEQSATSAAGGSVLVAYYSATGHTEGVANTIVDTLGADTFVITPTQPYTDDDLNWRQDDSRVNDEHEDPEGRHVALEQNTPDNWDSYDTVFVGYPIWWGGASWVLDDFAYENDFSGKTVIPFCTSTSSGLGNSATELADKAGTGDWQEGMRFSARADASEIQEWLDSLNL